MFNTINHNPTLTGAQILWTSLTGEGTTAVFGYPDGAILPICDAPDQYADSVSSASQGAITT